MVFRTNEQKQDLAASWHRPDRPFFAAGACHILAATFLEVYPEAGYSAVHIKPAKGFRGGHVVVVNADTVFDYHGYSERIFYFDHYFARMHRFFPGWSAQSSLLLESPAEWNFCQENHHRHPSQFFRDPVPRARAYLQRFRPPGVLLQSPCPALLFKKPADAAKLTPRP